MENYTKNPLLNFDELSGSNRNVCVILLYYATNYLIYKGERKKNDK